MARPFVYDWAQVKIKLAEYISVTDDPQLKEFCLSSDVPSYDMINQVSHEDDELAQLVKKLLAKQEVFLSRAKGIHPLMAMFRLKQKWHGYTDKQEIDVSTRLSYDLPPQVQLLTDGK